MDDLSTRLIEFCRGEAPHAIRYFPEYDNVPMEQRGTNLDFIYCVYVEAAKLLANDRSDKAAIRHNNNHLQIMMNAYSASAVSVNSGVFLDSAIESMLALPEAMRAVAVTLHEQKVEAWTRFRKCGKLFERKRDNREIPPVEIVSQQTHFMNLRNERAEWEDKANDSGRKRNGIIEFMEKLKEAINNQSSVKAYDPLKGPAIKAADDYGAEGPIVSNADKRKSKQDYILPEPA